MARYTVIYSEEISGDLTQLWMEASDRSGVTNAVNEIDRLLTNDPLSVGYAIHEELRGLRIEPVVVSYAVELDDRKVYVLSIRLIQE